MTCIADIAADYLATRRAMGYKLVEDGRLLTHLVAFLEAEGAEHLTVSDALAWAEQPPGAARVWWAAKLRVVRGFARYLLAFDPATEVPPARLLREPSHRVVPHIYSDEEVRRLMAAAGRLANDHRADTYRTVVGLLALSFPCIAVSHWPDCLGPEAARPWPVPETVRAQRPYDGNDKSWAGSVARAPTVPGVRRGRGSQLAAGGNGEVHAYSCRTPSRATASSNAWRLPPPIALTPPVG